MKKLTINLNRKLSEYDYYNDGIRYLLMMALWMLSTSTVMAAVFWTTFYILKYVTPIVIDLHKAHIIMITVTIGAFLCAILTLIPSCYQELIIRKILKKALHDDSSAEEWKNKFLSSEWIDDFNLIFAKDHNLLSDEEFINKKEIFVNNLDNIFFNGKEFISLVELKNALQFSDEQFAKIKNHFIATPESQANEAELLALQEYKILTAEEVAIKTSQFSVADKGSGYLKTMLTSCIYGVIAAILIFALYAISASYF